MNARFRFCCSCFSLTNLQVPSKSFLVWFSFKEGRLRTPDGVVREWNVPEGAAVLEQGDSVEFRLRHSEEDQPDDVSDVTAQTKRAAFTLAISLQPLRPTLEVRINDELVCVTSSWLPADGPRHFRPVIVCGDQTAIEVTCPGVWVTITVR